MPTTPPITPAISPVAADMYRRDASARAFGIELVNANESGATVTMTVRPDMCNGLGIMHGGMTFLLADSAMAFASNAQELGALASSAEIDWLAPVSVQDTVVAVAERRWTSGRSALWDVTVSVRVNDELRPIAMMRGRTRRASRATSPSPTDR